jgi:aerobic carbon-monoxide dehydrogenase small subunit
MHAESSIKLTINDVPWEGPVPADMTLLRLLRERLALTGAKEGCGIGECGACTILMDGRPVNACLVLAVEADGAQLRTIEGEVQRHGGRLSALQQAFIDHHAVQCGFCTPGMIIAAQALLERTPHPSDDEIIEAIAGNLCRCTGYASIIAAVRAAATTVSGSGRTRPPAAPPHRSESAGAPLGGKA